MRLLLTILLSCCMTASAQFGKTLAVRGAAVPKSSGITLEAETLIYATNIALNGGASAGGYSVIVR